MLSVSPALRGSLAHADFFFTCGRMLSAKLINGDIKSILLTITPLIYRLQTHFDSLFDVWLFVYFSPIVEVSTLMLNILGSNLTKFSCSFVISHLII